MTVRALAYLVAALAIALALSVLGNLELGRAWLAARDAHLQAVGERDQAQGTARSCSAGVAKLEQTARDRAAAARPVLAAADRQALTHDARAQQILASPPAAPGDACKSADDAINDWLQGRQQK